MIDIDTLLAWGAAYKKVSAGEIIFREETEACFYHQLVSGSVKWVNIGEDGTEFIQSMVAAGECFGELPLFDDEPYAATAIADTDSVLLRLHRSTFQMLIKDRPDILLSFTRMITQRLRFKFLFLKELAKHDPEQTIFSLLQYFKQTKKNICSKCNKVNLTRQQIADMTGMRVETVIRTIRHLHEKGQLQISKGKVYC